MADGGGVGDGNSSDSIPVLLDYADLLSYLEDDDDDIPGGFANTACDPVATPTAAGLEAQHYKTDQPSASGHGFPSNVDLYMDPAAAAAATTADNQFIHISEAAAPMASMTSSAAATADNHFIHISEAAATMASVTSAAAPPAARQADVLDCSGCQMLREIIHSNGFEYSKLCIHGDAGVFYHATLEVYRINSDGLHNPALTHQSYVDFRSRDYQWVKQYLTDYALRRAAGNFAVVHDSLALFHDVLCTTMNSGPSTVDVQEPRAPPATTDTNGGGGGGQLVAANSAAAAAVQPATGAPEDTHPSPGTAVVDVVQPPVRPVVRSALALQRERTARLQLQDIAPYFHLPMVEASKQLGVCATVLKGVCRKIGVDRWPHRKVKQIDREIMRLMRSGDGASVREGIDRLNAERRRIFEGTYDQAP